MKSASFGCIWPVIAAGKGNVGRRQGIAKSGLSSSIAKMGGEEFDAPGRQSQMEAAKQHALTRVLGEPELRPRSRRRHSGRYHGVWTRSLGGHSPDERKSGGVVVLAGTTTTKYILTAGAQSPFGGVKD